MPCGRPPALAQPFIKSGYGKYLLQLIEE